MDLKTFGQLALDTVTFDLSAEQRAQVMRNMGKVAWRVVVLGALTFVFATDYFARADGVQDLIASQAKPIIDSQNKLESEIKDIKREVALLSQVVNLSLARSLASDIRLVYAKQCREKDHAEWNRLQEELDAKQREYRARDPDREFYGPLSCRNP